LKFPATEFAELENEEKVEKEFFCEFEKQKAKRKTVLNRMRKKLRSGSLPQTKTFSFARDRRKSLVIKNA